MKKYLTVIVFLLMAGSALSQDNNVKPYKLIMGARVNPLVIYDFDGNRNEAVRLHGEIGLMWNKKWYFSFGYTPYMNSLYTFNEYWFLGMDKKIPVSIVASAEYMADNDKFILQGGPNMKLQGGNVFAFLFTPADKVDWGLKLGAFIPLNVILKERK
ncbi:hypothetical protein [Marinilabilia rubra]|uniref:DUF3575 domain-containing protein n=1 Tax=Marinilabilia rubra TaxID=2162893 RepID=A0A2U2B6F5_9BACT|nr:hypothetical protein [Marinilabilia rubra]PWD98623.1 hypothetical protein DDZ16_14270 [Marinilabilia rubra]